MTNVSVIDHPLVQQGLTALRDLKTPPEQFRRVMEQVTLLLAFDSTRNLETRRAPALWALMPPSQSVKGTLHERREPADSGQK